MEVDDFIHMQVEQLCPTPPPVIHNLLIIGNGFDLAHEMPTSYANFRDFVFATKDKLVYDMVDNASDDDEWSDFENRLADVSLNHVYHEDDIVDDGSLDSLESVSQTFSIIVIASERNYNNISRLGLVKYLLPAARYPESPDSALLVMVS